MEENLENAISSILIQIEGCALEHIQDPLFNEESFWFSWILLEKAYKSEPFKLCELSNYHFKQTINHEYSFRPKKLVSMIPKEILKDFPLKIYLCSENYFKLVGALNPFLEIKNDFHFPISSSEFLEIRDDTIDDDLGKVIKNNVLSKIFLEIITDTQYNEIEASKITFIKKDFPENIAPETEDPKTENFLRHYRLSIDIKSLKGLKRPYRASFQYSYPYLGSFNLVRTPLGWYHAKSETRVEKGATTFEYVTTKVKFREVLEKNYLDIKFVERSSLGDKKAGVASIHLLNIFDSPAHSFRCPVSGKLFQSIEEYEFYFDQCAQLYNAGELKMAPSREPEYLFVKDLYIPIYEVTYSDGNRETITNDVIGTVRMVFIIEDKGKVGRETPVNIQPGYVMHKGGLYDNDTDRQNIEFPGKEKVKESLDEELLYKGDYTRLQEWELWRQKAELEWKNSLQEKEIALRVKIRQEEEQKLANKSDDLRRAQIEIGKLQVRLKTSIEAVERQQMLLKNQEEQLTLRVNQKLQEMQLLARRVKTEAKASIDAEILKSQNIEKQNTILQENLKEMEKKAKQAEEDFEMFKNKHRLTSEFLLTEELAVLKAQLSAAHQQNEEEKKLRALAIAEKEQFRAQVHRLAQALKREKEKNNVLARQELEQLRLEFLAREERYVLDGDRSMLNNIRQDLAMLRSQL